VSAPRSALWQGRRVLVTGQTGFKGAWLCLWLERLGAKVNALALPPESPALYQSLTPWQGQVHRFGDIRDAETVQRAVAEAAPEVVFHLAAQAQVRRAYADPVGTYATNVMGTVNLLEAIAAQPGVRAVVVATTDKVYANPHTPTAQGAPMRDRPFVESDPLGGSDPYSASKAAAELVCRSYRVTRLSRSGTALATARAGNVVGGGDFSSDRLVPDFVRALRAGEPIALRYPDAVRPWQHVLEPLAGYLALAEALLDRPELVPPALNFGPAPHEAARVAEVADALAAAFGVRSPWRQADGLHPPEAPHLRLNSDLAAQTLGWRPRLSLAQTLDWTAEWYRAEAEAGDVRALCHAQIERFSALLDAPLAPAPAMTAASPLAHSAAISCAMAEALA